ncbi:hypothetical protein BDZ89DRAFT_1161714 [Hymenopellis radicata]|nr:hypothetical protein BDZ89DRAFT_1161714 [Hymenopellis radicata]
MQSVSPTLPSSLFATSSQDISDFLNTELFSSSSSSASSPASSSSLQTPPQSAPLASFADIYSGSSDFFSGGDMSVQSDLFNFLNGDMKSAPTFDDFVTTFGDRQSLGIDPSLMSSQSPSNSSPASSHSSTTSPTQQSPIEPVKVAGHGKARKGTVQSGGVTKKSAPAASRSQPKKEAKEALEKENDEDEDLDGDIPDSWRPSPEVYAKMTSKEKRQLRNKISARNFRVRRKEYISTLELDIAERDRLLTAIRSELGSTQSENQALRREIDALKNALLGGRTVKQEDSPTLSSPSLFSPLISSPKDILSSQSPMWGGLSAARVHTVLMPEWGNKGLQENINPALNASAPQPALANVKPQGFDGFADGNAFTLKNLDAYRMHLWTKMASQHTTSSPAHSHSSLSSSPSPPPIPQPHHSPLPDPRFSPSPFTNPSLPYLTGSPTLHGLASNMGVKFFRDSKPTPGPSLGALLSGKQPAKKPFASSTAGPTPEQALIATLAHQTLFKRLGGAFWDAFAGDKSPSSTSAQQPSIDSDKVRRVLEGKAVVRVVDVDSKLVPKPVEIKKEPTDGVCALLEESMRSLTINKK